MTCGRCGGSLTVQWGNTIERGGRWGPCPNCAPVNASIFVMLCRMAPDTVLLDRATRLWTAPQFPRREGDAPMLQGPKT